MTCPSVFGSLVAASDVETAISAQLETWLRDYLAEVDRVNGLAVGSSPQPRSWLVSSDIETMPEDQTPAVIVASPGLLEPPDADGMGKYSAVWRVAVAVVLSARGNRNALTLARRYALAIRACVLQQQVLGPLPRDAAVVRVIWIDERYDVLDSVDDRTTCSAAVEFGVRVADVTQRGAGPSIPTPPGEPLPDDSPCWPEATLVQTDVDAVPLSADLSRHS